MRFYLRTDRVLTAFISVLMALFCVSSQAARDGYSDTVTVVQGQTRLMPYPGVMRVSIGHPDIANAQATGPDEILLTGLKAGVTDLRVWTDVGEQKRYLLRVVDNSWVQILEVANIVLADIEGVNAREENGIVFIEGRIIREQDIPLIEDLKKKLEKQVKEGTVVFNVVKPTVQYRSMIMMDVQVVEVRRNDLKNLGIDWSATVGGPFFEIVGDLAGNAHLPTSTFFGFGFEDQETFTTTNPKPLTQLGSTIKLLQSKGVARILAQPKLVTRSGSSAEFLAGGEVPIPLANNDGAMDVTFKQFGVILKISPKADPEGFIETLIDVEVSRVDDSLQVLGIPGFTTRRTAMEMNVQSGQTMVISGMLQAEDSKAVNKLPGLGSIPVLGELFKSRDFQEATTELVIFVTPFLVDPESQWNKDMLDYGSDISQRAVKETKKWSLRD